MSPDLYFAILSIGNAIISAGLIGLVIAWLYFAGRP